MRDLIKRGQAYEDALRHRNDEMSMAANLVRDLTNNVIELEAEIREMTQHSVEPDYDAEAHIAAAVGRAFAKTL